MIKRFKLPKPASENRQECLCTVQTRKKMLSSFLPNCQLVSLQPQIKAIDRAIMYWIFKQLADTKLENRLYERSSLRNVLQPK